MIGSLGLILVGAGSSRRMGEIDKVWEDLCGRPIVLHSLHALAPFADECVLVIRREHINRAEQRIGNMHPVRVVAGGSERQESVLCGIRALGEVQAIAVHDVARPLATVEMLREGVRMLDSHDGAVPAIAVPDTMKEVSGHRVVKTMNRSVLRAVQTPQVFRAEALRAAHLAAAGSGRRVTDDAQLLEDAGYSVGIFPGDSRNFKVTTPLDLFIMRALVEGTKTE